MDFVVPNKQKAPKWLLPDGSFPDDKQQELMVMDQDWALTLELAVQQVAIELDAGPHS